MVENPARAVCHPLRRRLLHRRPHGQLGVWWDSLNRADEGVLPAVERAAAKFAFVKPAEICVTEVQH